ncbi:hypothetical protein JCM17960_14420 [Magnetospira thiophila]
MPETRDAQVYEGREFEATANLQNYYRWITEIFAPYLHGEGVEIGAGQGNYARYLKPYFSHLDLVEPSSAQTRKLQELADEGAVSVYASTIEDYRATVGLHSRDTLCLINVLEHIEDDNAALREFHALLRPGGHLCLFVPALPLLYSKLDGIVGHHRRYLREDLNRKVGVAGFDVVLSHYMDFSGIFAWGLINTLLGSTNLDPRMAQIYDRFAVPVTRAFERLVPLPFGKSLIMVARKTG